MGVKGDGSREDADSEFKQLLKDLLQRHRVAIGGGELGSRSAVGLRGWTFIY